MILSVGNACFHKSKNLFPYSLTSQYIFASQNCTVWTVLEINANIHKLDPWIQKPKALCWLLNQSVAVLLLLNALLHVLGHGSNLFVMFSSNFHHTDLGVKVYDTIPEVMCAIIQEQMYSSSIVFVHQFNKQPMTIAQISGLFSCVCYIQSSTLAQQ